LSNFLINFKITSTVNGKKIIFEKDEKSNITDLKNYDKFIVERDDDKTLWMCNAGYFVFNLNKGNYDSMIDFGGSSNWEIELEFEYISIFEKMLDELLSNRNEYNNLANPKESFEPYTVNKMEKFSFKEIPLNLSIKRKSKIRIHDNNEIEKDLLVFEIDFKSKFENPRIDIFNKLLALDLTEFHL
jgi:hypothetical protein